MNRPDVIKINFLTHVERNLDILLKYHSYWSLKIDKAKAEAGDYDLLGFYLDASKQAKESGMRLKRIPFFLEWLWYSIENPTYKKFYDILDRLPDRFKFPEFDLQKIRQRYKKNIPILDSWFSWKIYKMPAIKDFWRDGWFPRWYEEYHKPHAFELIKTGLKKESRKRKILDFVQKNPEATSREIQQKFTIKKSDLETFLPTQDRF